MEKPYPALTTSPTRRARDAILNSSQTGGAGDTYPAANLGCPIRSTDPPPFWLRRSYRLGSSLKASDLSGGPCPMEKPYPALTTSPTRRARDAILNSSQTGGAGDTYPAANLGCPIRSTDPPPFWLRRSYRLGSSLKGPFSTPRYH
ncbi:hypothetical protein J6590_105019 [Homalodisca vitripennis]|nr:hypothetical protein J6590_105019 [Homalodisca vitripennis]